MADGPEVRRREGARRFNLGDLMIVVVAVGVGCGLARRPWLDLGAGDFAFATPTSVYRSVERVPVLWLEIIGTGWAVATFAVLAMRLRRPRPRWRRLMRQPGWLACLASAITIVAVAGFKQFSDAADRNAMAITLAREGISDPIAVGFARFVIYPANLTPIGGLVVLVTWTLLCADGRWAGERSWIDRAGRLIGVGWLLLPAGFVIVYRTSLLGLY